MRGILAIQKQTTDGETHSQRRSSCEDAHALSRGADRCGSSLGSDHLSGFVAVHVGLERSRVRRRRSRLVEVLDDHVAVVVHSRWLIIVLGVGDGKASLAENRVGGERDVRTSIALSPMRYVRRSGADVDVLLKTTKRQMRMRVFKQVCAPSGAH